MYRGYAQKGNSIVFVTDQILHPFYYFISGGSMGWSYPEMLKGQKRA
jgi:hypothetical protein